MKRDTLKRSTQDVAAWGGPIALLALLAFTASLSFGESALQMKQYDRSPSHGKMTPALERLAAAQDFAAAGASQDVSVIVQFKQ